MADDLHELHVQMPVSLIERVRLAAAADDRSVTSWVRRALTEKLDRFAQLQQQQGEATP